MFFKSLLQHLGQLLHVPLQIILVFRHTLIIYLNLLKYIIKFIILRGYTE